MAEGILEGLLLDWDQVRRQAFDALARYKFWMFGYHASRVIFLATLISRAGGPRLANPFKALVDTARAAYCRQCGEMRNSDHRCTSDSLEWAEPTMLLLLEAQDD